MDASKFEEELDDLVTKGFDGGLDFDAIISAFEIKLMALREEASAQ